MSVDVMRSFEDARGRTWTATVQEEPGADYKGRYYLVMAPVDASNERFALTDVRWNSPRTARRTIETMSLVELRRRLRQAVGRGSEPVSR